MCTPVTFAITALSLLSEVFAPWSPSDGGMSWEGWTAARHAVTELEGADCAVD